MTEHETDQEARTFIEQFITSGAGLVILVILIVVAGWAAYNFVGFYGAPDEVAEEQVSQLLTYQTDFSYSVTPVESLLYPEPRPISDPAVFFSKITDEVRVDWSTTIEADPATPLEGSYEVWLVLKAPELWEKRYLLEAAAPFSGTDGQVRISGSFPLNYQERMAFIDGVMEETSVWPREGHQLQVVPRILLQPGELQMEVENPYSPEFALQIKGQELMALSEQEQTKQAQATETTTRPNLVAAFGKRRTVDNAFTLYGITALIALALLGPVAGVRWNHYQKRRAAGPTPEYLNRKHAGRLINAGQAPAEVLDLRPGIMVEDFDDLLQVADELEKPIMHYVEQASAEGEKHVYCVLEEQHNYTYVVRNEG